MKRLTRVAAALATMAMLTTPVLAQQPAPRTISAESGTRLITLGTGGGPIVRRYRAGPTSLLVVDGRLYLFDCGEGAARRLAEAGYMPSDVSHVFLTHLHFDHTAGLGALLAFNWQFEDRKRIEIHGPPGTAAIVASAVQSFDVAERLFAPSRPPGPTMGQTSRGVDLLVDGTEKEIFRDDKIRVVAVENSHYRTLKIGSQAYGPVKSYSYRVETPHRVIVFTGDTGPSEAVTRLARGADILVSEIISLERILPYVRARNRMSDEQLKGVIMHLTEHHVTPEQVGDMAAKAQVKAVILSHIVPGGDGEASTLAYTNGVRARFRGTVVAARDLDEF